ncbi:Xenotropic and polytropic retrovirus receptor 1 [Knufia fluminis]|uniref:Xenotropic and polytropic retrovirus receptor 1 n=1 Tax=Knufia fluminis TaxID=191047 RepID=A0AAN8EB48_9EURO|nr:Xenotropic and polytropic retrovirus receptor 1 [Knufia fluminis]
MKFAKELENDLVPEWRAKYINYKQGKKKIKAISKALRNANRTPRITGRPELSRASSVASIPYTHYDFNSRAIRKAQYASPGTLGQQDGSADADPRAQMQDMRKMSTTMFTTSPPIHDRESEAESSSDGEGEGSDESDEERTPLKRTASGTSNGQMPASYGSFSPPERADPTSIPTTPKAPGRMPKLSLPDPALDPGRERTQSQEVSRLEQERSISERNGRVPQLKDVDRPDNKKHNSVPLLKGIVQKKLEERNKIWQQPPTAKFSARDRFQKIFRARKIDSPDVSNVQRQAYNDLDARQDDFFNFLDKELNKVEKFYKMKEDEAQDRLNVLRAQLHEHRDQRARDMQLQRQGRHHLIRQDDAVSHVLAETPLPSMPTKEVNQATQNGGVLKNVFKHEPKIGKTSQAMKDLASPAVSPQSKAKDDKKDYVKKKPTKGNETVPHRFAKRRLKLALQEFYRGMELLKSYALLNRTGFRKINKKYDKAVNARPPLQYLNEKVSQAHFVKSTVIDAYLVAVEDLYARYFERGNRKVAVNRLRSKLRQGDHSAATFRNGLWVAAGTGLGIAGLYNGFELLFNGSPATSTITSYLLQMYAGYFLALLLFLIFVLNCKIWSKARINYVFVFEYDTRHTLDWRQLAEIPCFFLFLNGLFVWINFEFGDAHFMFRFWPVVLFGITLIIMALPFKVLYYHARKWWAFSNFRLLFAGLYPVEFRDFFLGDMYTSETYAMSQIEVFFCVYGNDWNNPAQCNSSHSMLLGFFTTLPAIWRFAQCVRRYKDSGNWFPHLANCAKYTGNILYYMTLSLYRLHIHTESARAYKIVFIVFAALNALYCSFWDIAMDWSLGNFFSKHKGLRDHLAYRRKWVYYAAIVFDIVLRHQWILYAIFTEDLQHSSAVSFFVALAEVLRRGVWTLFRVENEHTNNVAKFRASRDIPLPYKLPQSPKKVPQDQESEQIRRRRQSVSGESRRTQEETFGTTTGTDHDLERQTTTDSGSTTRRTITRTPALRALQRVGTVIAAAHSQDFTKKRRPEVVGDSPHDETMLKDDHQDSSDDDDDDGRTEIEPSVVDEDERREEAHEVEGQRDDGGEGSSSDSQAQERAGVLEVQDSEDIDEARSIAQGYSPEAGLRGGKSSSKKKDL